MSASLPQRMPPSLIGTLKVAVGEQPIVLRKSVTGFRLSIVLV